MKSVRLWIGTVLVAAVVGCEAPPVEAPIPPKPKPAADMSPAGRARSMQPIVESMTARVDRLPGYSMTDHRKLLVGLLDDTAQLLLLANGPDPSPGFGNRIGVIDHARDAASNPTLPRERINGVETEALHAAGLAVMDLKARSFFDDDELTPMVDALKAELNKIGGIDDQTGQMHDLASTEAFRKLLPVLSRMSADMTARFGTNLVPPEAGPDNTPQGQNPSTSMPTTEPTTTPTTGPADESLQKAIDKAAEESKKATTQP